MKLYTEKQVKQFLKERTFLREDTIDAMCDTLIPIELPSNEEIKDKSFNNFTQSNARTCFEEGAKWVREKILNQNK
jgi:hypothetical protein